jgi:hypothetical protein
MRASDDFFIEIGVAIFVLKVQSGIVAAQVSGVLLNQMRDKQNSPLQIGKNPAHTQIIAFDFL